MKKLPNMKGLAVVGKTFIMANRPEILFGAAVTATIGAVVLAAKGGYEARGIVEEAQNPGLNLKEPATPLTARQKANLTWHCYMPAAVAGVTAVGSTGALHLVHIQEKKALAQASLAAIEELKEQAKSLSIAKELGIVTEEDEETIEAEKSVQEASTKTISDNELTDLYLVRDGKTGRDIYSSENRIQEAVNLVNDAINKHGDCELNTFYSHAGFDLTPDGDDWGWSGDHVEITWDTTVRADGRPVKRFRFATKPQEGYDRAIQ